jgi:peptidoglycan/LPS O-acetylase OafA/YrhL
VTAVFRYPWMFRTAAVVYLLLGASMAWRYGLTDYDPPHRPWGSGAGVLMLTVGVCLFGRRRWAVGLSAIGAAIIAMAAAVAAPVMHGPVILACALVAIVFGVYAVMAGRVLLERTPG